jgi:hypothetical protein
MLRRVRPSRIPLNPHPTPPPRSYDNDGIYYDDDHLPLPEERAPGGAGRVRAPRRRCLRLGGRDGHQRTSRPTAWQGRTSSPAQAAALAPRFSLTDVCLLGCHDAGVLPCGHL